MTCLSGSHRNNFTLWKWKGVLAVITAVVFLLPAMAAAQNSPPVADAGPDQSIYVGELIILEGSATDPDNNDIVGWQWTIETLPAGSAPYLSDAGIPDPIFQPDVAGDYLLSLIAFDGLDWSAPDFVTISAADILPPVAVAIADVTTGVAPLTVNFDGSQSYDQQGGDLAYRWNFGDGSASSFEVAPVHTYDTTGTFIATLDVQDTRGQEDSDTIQITVTPEVNNPPVASPTAMPNPACIGEPVQFAANASDPEQDPLTYAWDFGDSGTGTVADPTHVYTSPGEYGVWLTVSDGVNEVTESILVVVEGCGNIYGCVGFEPPMDNGPVTVKKNRALPLKAYLYDEYNNLITDADITAPPVLQVLYSSGISGEAIDVTDASLSAGEETESNEFYFDFNDEMKWRLNLKLKNTYTAAGTYQLYMVSGDDTEYTIDPTCVAEFVIK